MYKILASNDCNNSSTDKHYDATKIVIASGTMTNQKSRLLAVSKNLKGYNYGIHGSYIFLYFLCKEGKDYRPIADRVVHCFKDLFHYTNIDYHELEKESFDFNILFYHCYHQDEDQFFYDLSNNDAVYDYCSHHMVIENIKDLTQKKFAIMMLLNGWRNRCKFKKTIESDVNDYCENDYFSNEDEYSKFENRVPYSAHDEILLRATELRGKSTDTKILPKVYLMKAIKEYKAEMKRQFALLPTEISLLGIINTMAISGNHNAHVEIDMGNDVVAIVDLVKRKE